MLSKTWDDAPNFMLAHVVNKVRYVELHYDLWIDISRLKTAFIHCVFYNFRANYCADTNIDKSKLTQILNQDAMKNSYK